MTFDVWQETILLIVCIFHICVREVWSHVKSGLCKILCFERVLFEMLVWAKPMNLAHMKCAKWNSEKWNDNLSYCVVNIRRMEVSLEICKAWGLSDPTSEMVSSFSSWSVWQRWSRVEKLHPRRSILFPWCHLHKPSAWLRWYKGWGGGDGPQLTWTLVIGTQEIWLSITLTCLWHQVLISSVEDNQRASLWAFIIHLWMHTGKAVRRSVKNDLDSLSTRIDYFWI